MRVIPDGVELSSPIKSEEHQRSVDLLSVLSVVYLSLPLLIFLLTFPAPQIACPLALIACWQLLRLFQNLRMDRPDSQSRGGALSILLAAAIAFAWVACTGLLFSFQSTSDWVKHYAVFNALRDCPWPPHFQHNGMDFYLRYYVGWLLLPAGLAGYLPKSAGQGLLFVWTWIGVTLAFVNMARFSALRTAVFLTCFIFFGGLDIVGYWFVGQNVPPAHEGFEWWSRPFGFQYLAQTNLILWVPQHAVAAWLGTSLLLERERAEALVPFSGLISISILLWSPFAAAGLVPLFLFQTRRRFADIFNRANIAMGVVGLVVLIYLLQEAAGIPATWTSRSRAALTVFNYVLVIFVEGLVWVLALVVIASSREYRGLLLLSALVLSLIPLFKIGAMNDWSLRASIPALTVIAFLVSWEIAHGSTTSRLILLPLLLVGAISPFLELRASVASGPPNVAWRADLVNAPMTIGITPFFGMHAEVQLFAHRLILARNAPVCPQR